MKLTALKNIIKEEITKLQNEQAHPLDASLPAGQSMHRVTDPSSTESNSVLEYLPALLDQNITKSHDQSYQYLDIALEISLLI